MLEGNLLNRYASALLLLVMGFTVLHSKLLMSLETEGMQ